MRSLIAIVAVLLISLSSCKFFKEKGWFQKNKADTLVVWLAHQDSIRVADSIKVEIEMMKAIEQARVDSVMAAEEARIEMESSFKYHIIVGSFLTPEYANDHLAYYKNMGYTGAQIIKDRRDRFNLVSAEAFDSIKKAITKLRVYQDTVEFEAWLYISD